MTKAILNELGRDPVRRRTYTTWRSMLLRCENQDNHNYPYYGGKGIKVCKRWHDFENFVTDMGWRPVGMTLDREKSYGNYTKSNCRWATKTQQANNTSYNRKLTHKGVTLNLAQWAKRVSLPSSTIASRLRRNWSVSKTLTTPTRSNAVRLITYKGQTLSIAEWSKTLKVSDYQLRKHLNLGHSMKKSLEAIQ